MGWKWSLSCSRVLMYKGRLFLQRRARSVHGRKREVRVWGRLKMERLHWCSWRCRREELVQRGGYSLGVSCERSQDSEVSFSSVQRKAIMALLSQMLKILEQIWSSYGKINKLMRDFKLEMQEQARNKFPKQYVFWKWEQHPSQWKLLKLYNSGPEGERADEFIRYLGVNSKFWLRWILMFKFSKPVCTESF